MLASKHNAPVAASVQGMLACMLALSFLNSGCAARPDSPEDVAPPTSGDDSQDIYLGGEIAAAFTGDPTFGAIAVHENGERIVAITETAGDGIQRVAGAIWLGSNDEAMVVLLGTDGLPFKAFLGDIILLFGNYASDSVDLAILLPDGSVELAEDVPVDPAMLEDLRGSAAPSSSKIASIRRMVGGLTLRDVLQATSSAISIVGCASALGLVPFSAGASGVLAVAICGGAIVSTWNYFRTDSDPALSMTSGMLGTTGCLLMDPGSCFSVILDLSAESLHDAEGLEYERSQAVSDGIALLSGMTSSGEESRAPWSYDYSSTDDFIEAVRQALSTENLNLFSDLLCNPIYLHGIAGPGGSIGIVEQSPQSALDLLSNVMDEFDLSTLPVTVAMGDVSSFSVPPRVADHTIIVPVYYGLRLGFDFVGDRYCITDIWLEVQ